MKVKLIPIHQFGRYEFRPANDLAKTIAKWLGKNHLSLRDKEFIEEMGLEPVVLTHGEG